MPVTWRDLRGSEQGMCARLSKPHAHPRAGARAVIVASKPGNAGGPKSLPRTLWALCDA
jgi:hypothetical protein